MCRICLFSKEPTANADVVLGVNIGVGRESAWADGLIETKGQENGGKKEMVKKKTKKLYGNLEKKDQISAGKQFSLLREK